MLCLLFVADLTMRDDTKNVTFSCYLPLFRILSHGPNLKSSSECPLNYNPYVFVYEYCKLIRLKNINCIYIYVYIHDFFSEKLFVFPHLLFISYYKFTE